MHIQLEHATVCASWSQKPPLQVHTPCAFHFEQHGGAQERVSCVCTLSGGLLSSYDFPRWPGPNRAILPQSARHTKLLMGVPVNIAAISISHTYVNTVIYQETWCAPKLSWALEGFESIYRLSHLRHNHYGHLNHKTDIQVEVVHDNDG